MKCTPKVGHSSNEVRCSFHMAKYTLEFKLAVVEYFLSGQGGQKATAKQFGIDHGAVRKWVAVFQQHSQVGLQSRQTKMQYSAVFKETVILYIQQHHVSARTAAAHFNIPAFGMINQWQRLYDESGLVALEPKPRGRRRIQAMIHKPSKPLTQHSLEILTKEELIRQLEYLQAENACLKKLQALIQNKETLAAKKKLH